MSNTKPTRCIDPIMKFCQECQWGWCKYPDWVETREDLADCTFESGCTLGFDQGRPEDEPTEEELAEFNKIVDRFNSIPEQSFFLEGYETVTDNLIKTMTEDSNGDNP